MREILRKYREIWSFAGGSLLLIAAPAIWAWRALRGIEEPLILHFSGYTGISQIGSLGNLLGISVTAAVILFINTGVALALAERDKLLSRFLMFITLFFVVLLFIGFAAIISVNS